MLTKANVIDPGLQKNEKQTPFDSRRVACNCSCCECLCVSHAVGRVWAGDVVAVQLCADVEHLDCVVQPG